MTLQKKEGREREGDGCGYVLYSECACAADGVIYCKCRCSIEILPTVARQGLYELPLFHSKNEHGVD